MTIKISWHLPERLRWIQTFFPMHRTVSSPIVLVTTCVTLTPISQAHGTHSPSLSLVAHFLTCCLATYFAPAICTKLFCADCLRCFPPPLELLFVTLIFYLLHAPPDIAQHAISRTFVHYCRCLLRPRPPQLGGRRQLLLARATVHRGQR